MKRTIILLAVLICVFLLAVVLQATVSSGIGETKNRRATVIEWNTFDKGFELAQKQKKMLVIDFYTDWCHWCKVMDKETYGNQAVIDFARQHVIMAKVNAESNEKFRFKGASYSGRELTMMFGVEGFPTTAFVNDKGELITKISGFIAADKFTLILKYLAGNWYEKMKFDEFLKKEQAKVKS